MNNSSDLPVRLTLAFKKVKQGYIAYVEKIPGANSQGATLKEAKENILEALVLILDSYRKLFKETEKDNFREETLELIWNEEILSSWSIMVVF